MNVLQIIGYRLLYMRQSSIIYDKNITKSDIENALIKYYDEKTDAYFKVFTYCLFSLEEKKDVTELIKLCDIILNRLK